jgi:hypothetical protein
MDRDWSSDVCSSDLGWKNLMNLLMFNSLLKLLIH